MRTKRKVILDTIYFGIHEKSVTVFSLLFLPQCVSDLLGSQQTTENELQTFTT